MSLTRHLRRLAHRRNRDRARRTARVTATTSGVLLAAGTLVAVPFLGGAGAATTPTVKPGSPVGSAQHMVQVPGGIHFTGWALDPNTTAPISVYVTVDGKVPSSRTATTVANLPRQDLDATVPQADGHGYDTTVLIPAGRHTICTWARNVDAGQNVSLRCMTATLNYSPVGAVTSISASHGSVHVAGWAFDADAPTSPVTVGVVIDNNSKGVHRIVADQRSTAAQSAHPGGGANHGFAADIPVTQGRHAVRIGFYNLGGYGGNTYNVGSATVTLNDSPVGGLDTLAREGSGIRVTGWGYDPDSPTTPLTVRLTVDGAMRYLTANQYRSDVAQAHPSAGARHGFSTLISGLAEGPHQVCVTLLNLDWGSDRALDCRPVPLQFTPSAALTSVSASDVGVLTVSGWASDPDTTKPIRATVSVSPLAGGTRTVTANAAANSHTGHAFTTTWTTRSGTYKVCVTGLNVDYGTHNSTPACRSVTVALSPKGQYAGVTRTDTGVTVTGWVWDPDNTIGTSSPAPSSVRVTVDGTVVSTAPATVYRSDVHAQYPSSGSARTGYSVAVPASSGEHTVCVTAVNTGGGSDVALGCKAVWATVVTAPTTVRSAKAVPGYGQAALTWAAPSSDGGAPVSYYLVTSGTTTAKVSATAYTATSLATSKSYTFSIVAVNAAGQQSPIPAMLTVTTLKGPAPQTSPAPISTSRYIRNISNSASSSDLTWMRNAGLADARANPSGHRYLILLDIGGQNSQYQGVALSATTKFVSYANLVKDINAYVDGYAAGQRSTAPVVIAIGTNNDMDVSQAAGADWANKVVDPVMTHAAKYADLTVAGANDIEPGFTAGYGATRSWLTGYLGNTTANFVFNGSADGCAWTVTNRSCNNGWTMARLYDVSAGAAPSRMIALPQIYNSTMAAQWKYISLTGVQNVGKPRIVFGGALTEWTACSQAGGSCFSLTGNSAWTYMWNNLQSDPRLRVTSLPYSTDLRIN